MVPRQAHFEGGLHYAGRCGRPQTPGFHRGDQQMGRWQLCTKVDRRRSRALTLIVSTDDFDLTTAPGNGTLSREWLEEQSSSGRDKHRVQTRCRTAN